MAKIGRPPGGKNPNAGRKKIPLIMALPHKQIIFEQVIYWINVQATQEEVAGSFHVSVETLNFRLMEHFGLNFTDLRKRVDGEAKLSLRRYQFQQAKTKPNMAIWLGKVWLGQQETIVTETIVKENDPVQVYIPDNGRNDWIGTKVEDPNA